MATENIIAVNVPNAASITIMALVGGLLVAALRKLVLKKRSGVQAGASFST